MAATDEMDDPNKTGRFRFGIQGPGGVRAWFEGKGLVAFFAGVVLVLLLWGGAFLVEQRQQNEDVKNMLKSIQKSTGRIECMFAANDEERKSSPGLAARCRAASEYGNEGRQQ